MAGSDILSVRMGTDTAIMQAVEDANVAFTQATTGKTGHGLGISDHFAAIALLQVVAKMVPPADAELIAAFITAHPPGNAANELDIKLCRLEKCWKGSEKKLFFRLAPPLTALCRLSSRPSGLPMSSCTSALHPRALWRERHKPSSTTSRARAPQLPRPPSSTSSAAPCAQGPC